MGYRFITEEEIRARLWVECDDNQRQWSLKRGLSPQHINDFLHRRQPPSKELLGELGYRRVVLYERIEE